MSFIKKYVVHQLMVAFGHEGMILSYIERNCTEEEHGFLIPLLYHGLIFLF